MPSRWPARPETLVNRLEAALLTMAETPVMADHETIKRVQANYRIARANLLARIMPATDYQRRGAGHA